MIMDDNNCESTCSVCYVMCGYVGPNRVTLDNMNIEDIIIEHVRRADEIHGISQCVVVLPVSQHESKEFISSLSNVESRGWDVIRRENFGYSYASLIEAYAKHPTHDWYIFQEDDYFPRDMDLVAKLLKHANIDDNTIDYVGLVYDQRKSVKMHMSASGGIINNKTLLLMQNYLSAFKEKDIAKNGAKSQLIFSENMLKNGIKLGDVLDYYPCVYREGFHKKNTTFIKYISKITPKDAMPLFIPAQMSPKDKVVTKIFR